MTNSYEVINNPWSIVVLKINNKLPFGLKMLLVYLKLVELSRVSGIYTKGIGHGS